MTVLVLQLAGPLQSWGSSARFARRTTEPAPTKSGVVGLLAAALGRDRRDDITELAALRFAVRIDQRGTLLRDYQTAHHFDTDVSMPVSERFYLADAVFVAAVEADDQELAEELHRALRRPWFLPYLGRRSCPPARPLDLGLRHDTTLIQALENEPWQAAGWYQRRHAEHDAELEVRVEAATGEGAADSLRDQPLSFDPAHRRYGLRRLHTTWVKVPNPVARRRRADHQIHDHDPTALLEGA